MPLLDVLITENTKHIVIKVEVDYTIKIHSIQNLLTQDEYFEVICVQSIFI